MAKNFYNAGRERGQEKMRNEESAKVEREENVGRLKGGKESREKERL